ncbi:DUF2829 domain-containing protein [Phyllobacterium myrsinacearum]|uniref:Thoeris anti-defense 2-like domain-containing protein n=1 Tax=Phyllobacterium myrsinacearum TaxID=28101 RepID=A0A839ENP7_9HYPH|nr:DUF2829 domain-containing protein [Phyllobacterium myrsinacearum]MBA8881711.1 hypothetical protein [Phyllobacterium myrsinacearum]
MNFGQAIEIVKRGGKVAREGWNGKRMFVFLHPGSAPRATQVKPVSPDLDLIAGIDKNHFETGAEGSTIRLPSLGLRTVDGSMLIGWLASQTDVLAEDWQEVR